MSRLICTIKSIQTHKSLNIVTFDFEGYELKMLSFDVNEMIKKSKKALLYIKPSAVGILKNFSGNISFSNRFKGNIIHIDNGTLLSTIILKIGKTELEAVIMRQSVQDMKLCVGDEVTAVIRASELSLLKVL